MDGPTKAMVYICQFGDTAQAYAFAEIASGELAGLGSIEGWTALAQEGGLVARNADKMLVIGEGPDSLIENGQLVQGQCTDASGDLAQLFDNGSLGASPGTIEAQPSNEVPTDLVLPEAEALAPRAQATNSDDFLAGMLAILDPMAWDTVKVAAIVDVLSLDQEQKLALKAALRAADNDPGQIRAIARQIQRAIGAELASDAQLRARLQDARRDLEDTTRALDEQHQRVQQLASQLSGAEARASAAERRQNQTTALLGAAQRGLKEKVAELARAAQNLATLNRRLNEAQQNGVALQAALAAAGEDQQNAAFQITTLTEQLVDMRARLARANDRIDELRAVKK